MGAVDFTVSTRDAGKFAAVLQAEGGRLVVPGGEAALLGAEFMRAGPDLILIGPDGQQILILGFFSGVPTDLAAETGAVIDAALAGKLAGPVAPGQFAQAEGGASMVAIGKVSIAQGRVEVRRADGSRAELKPGDEVYQDDVLSTADGAAVGLIFMDGTTFSLGSGGRMVLDDMVYDAAAQTGSASISVVTGAFTLVSGAIPKVMPDAMQLKTPAMTIGIRGTGVAGNGTTVALMAEQGGVSGEITVTTPSGQTLTLNVPGSAASLGPGGQLTQTTLSPQQIAQMVGNALNALPNRQNTLSDDMNQAANNPTGPEQPPAPQPQSPVDNGNAPGGANALQATVMAAVAEAKATVAAMQAIANEAAVTSAAVAEAVMQRVVDQIISTRAAEEAAAAARVKVHADVAVAQAAVAAEAARNAALSLADSAAAANYAQQAADAAAAAQTAYNQAVIEATGWGSLSAAQVARAAAAVVAAQADSGYAQGFAEAAANTAVAADTWRDASVITARITSQGTETTAGLAVTSTKTVYDTALAEAEAKEFATYDPMIRQAGTAAAKESRQLSFDSAYEAYRSAYVALRGEAGLLSEADIATGSTDADPLVNAWLSGAVSAKQALTEAIAADNAALADLSAAQTAYTNAKAAANTAATDYNDAVQALTTAAAARGTAEASEIAAQAAAQAQAEAGMSAAMTLVQSALATATTASQTAQAEAQAASSATTVGAAETARDNASAAATTAGNAVTAANSALSNAQTALTIAYNNTLPTNALFASAPESLRNAALQAYETAQALYKQAQSIQQETVKLAAQAQSSLNLAQQSYDLLAVAEVTGIGAAQTSAATAATAAGNAVTRAETAVEAALAAKTEAETLVAQLTEKYPAATALLNSARQALANITTAYDNAIAARDAALIQQGIADSAKTTADGAATLDAARDAAQAAATAAKSASSAASTAATQAAQASNLLVGARNTVASFEVAAARAADAEAAQAALTAATSAKNAADSAYNSAVTARNNANTALEEAARDKAAAQLAVDNLTTSNAGTADPHALGLATRALQQADLAVINATKLRGIADDALAAAAAKQTAMNTAFSTLEKAVSSTLAANTAGQPTATHLASAVKASEAVTSAASEMQRLASTANTNSATSQAQSLSADGFRIAAQNAETAAQTSISVKTHSDAAVTAANNAAAAAKTAAAQLAAAQTAAANAANYVDAGNFSDLTAITGYLSAADTARAAAAAALATANGRVTAAIAARDSAQSLVAGLPAGEAGTLARSLAERAATAVTQAQASQAAALRDSTAAQSAYNTAKDAYDVAAGVVNTQALLTTLRTQAEGAETAAQTSLDKAIADKGAAFNALTAAQNQLAAINDLTTGNPTQAVIDWIDAQQLKAQAAVAIAQNSFDAAEAARVTALAAKTAITTLLTTADWNAVGSAKTAADTAVAEAATAARQAQIARAHAERAAQAAGTVADLKAGYDSYVAEYNAQVAAQTVAAAKPLLTADSVAVNEDNSVTINVLGNDTTSGFDANGNGNFTDPGDIARTGLVFAASGNGARITLGTPANGTAVVNADGTVTYTPKANFFGTDSFTYTVSNVVGSTTHTATATVTITVNAVNDVPVVSISTTPLAYTEGGTVTVTPALTVTDVDSATLTQATVTIGGFVAGQDVLQFTNQSGISGTFNSSTGVLTLTGTASLAAYQTALRSVTYKNTGTLPDNSPRTIEVRVFDGTDWSVPKSRDLTITTVNQAPVLTTEQTVEGTEDQVVSLPGSTFTAAYSDREGSPLASIRIDSLPLNGTLRLGANAVTAGQVIAAADLGNLTFTPNADWSGTASFSWRAHDGQSWSALSTFRIAIANVNDAPVLTGNASLPAIKEDPEILGGTAISSILSNNFSDVDSSMAGILVTANTADAATEGVWRFFTGTDWADIGPASESSAVALSADTMLMFVPVANYHGTPSGLVVRAVDATYAGQFSDSAGTIVTVDATVNGGATAISATTAAIGITVNPSNDTPEFSGGVTMAAIDRGTDPAGATIASLFTPVFSDIDDGDTLAGIAITSAHVENGAWQYSTDNGATWHGVGAIFNASQALALSASTMMRFVPNTGYFGAADQLFAAPMDSSYPGGWTTGGSRVTVDTMLYDPYSPIGSPVFLSQDITFVNDAPVLGAVALTGTEDTLVNIGGAPFLGAYSDADGDALHSVEILTLGTGGDLKLSGVVVTINQVIAASDLPNLTFEPSPDWNGTSSFTWRGYDGFEWSAPATANIGIAAVNDVPVVTSVQGSALLFDGDDSFIVPTTVSTKFSGADSFSVVMDINPDPAGGTLWRQYAFGGELEVITEVVADGSLRLYFGKQGVGGGWHATGANAIAFDEWSQVAFVKNGSTALIYVNGVEILSQGIGADGTTAAATQADTRFGDSHSSNFYNGELGGLKVYAAALGPAALAALADGVAVDDNLMGDWRIDEGSGTTLTDSKGLMGNITLPGTITWTNKVGDVFSLLEDTAASGSVIVGDVDGDTVTGSVHTQAAFGTVVYDDVAGVWTYTPEANYHGADSFVLRFSDGHGGIVDKTISLQIHPVNDAPVLDAVALAGTEDTALVIGAAPFLDAYTDADGDALHSIEIQTLATGGNLKLSGVVVTVNQVIAAADLPNLTFDPMPDWNGSTSFTWRGFDGLEWSASATATIDIAAVNDAPVINNQRGDFLISTHNAGEQEGATVLALTGGGFWTAWQSFDPATGDSSSGAVALQRFDMNGHRLGGEILVNTNMAGGQWGPAMTQLGNGNVLVVWQSNDPALTGGGGIAARIFSSADGSGGAEFQLNASPAGALSSSLGTPSVATLPGGRFVAAWVSGGDGSGTGIVMRVFNEDGSMPSAEIPVNTLTPGNQEQPSVAALSNGNIVVVWNSGGDIRARLFDNQGTAITDEFAPNQSANPNYEYDPSVTALMGGGFVVVWDAGTQISARHYDHNGTPVTAEFRVDTSDADGRNPVVKAFGDGSYLVTWTFQGSALGDTSGGIAGQYFDPQGRKIGGEFLVNTATQGFQGNQDMAVLNGTDVVVVWNSRDPAFGDSSSGNAVGRILKVPPHHHVGEDSQVSGNVTAMDAEGDMVSYYLLDGAGNRVTSLATAHGMVTIDSFTGHYTYTPGAAAQALNVQDMMGDSFKVVAFDGVLESVPQIVNVTITGMDDPTQVGAPVSFSTGFNAPLIVSAAELLANATDIDNTLSVANVTVSGGSVVDNLDGTWTITPTPGFSGAMNLNYDIRTDDNINTPAMASITVAAVGVAGVTNAGGALAFDGVDDLATANVAMSAAAGTIEMWVQKNWAAPNDQNIIGNDRSGDTAGTVYISDHHTAGLHFRYGGVGQDVGNIHIGWTGSRSWADGSWHHVAATWEHEGGITTLRLFADGQQVATTTTTLLIDASALQTWVIGKDTYPGVAQAQDWLKGAVDDVRMWSVARDAAEIQASYRLKEPTATDGLLANWTMDAVESGAILDANGGPGLTLGTSPGADAGDPRLIDVPPRALNFNGATNVVVSGDFEIGSGPLTMEAWINTSNTVSRQAILTVGTDVFRGSGYLYVEGGTLRFDLAMQAGLNSGVNVADGLWHHVAAVLNPNGTVTLYVDGNAVGSHAFDYNASFAGGYYDIGDGPVVVGASFDYGTHYFNGQIADARVWDIARTPADIAGGMNVRTGDDEYGLLLGVPLDTLYFHDNVPVGTTTTGDAGWTQVAINGTPTLVNTKPPSASDIFEVREDTPFGGQILAEGSGAVTVALAPDGGPANGSLWLNPDGTFQYRPHEDFSGTDSFTVEIVGGGTTVTRTFQVVVSAVDDPADLSPPPAHEHGTLNFHGGSGSYVAVDPAIATGTSALTIEAWVRTGSTATAGLVVFGNAAIPAGEVRVMMHEGKFHFGFSDRAGVSSTTSIADNDWHHVAVTLSGTGRATLYVDGVAETVHEFGGFDIQALQASIGGNFGVNGFAGALSDVRVWTAERTAQQIADGMLAAPSAVDPDLHAWWPLDEGSGTVVNDATGSFAGTVMGNPHWGDDVYAVTSVDTPLALDGVSVFDPDQVANLPAVLKVTIAAGHGSITLGGTVGLTFLESTTNGSGRLVFEGSVSDINAALASASYQPSNGFAGRDSVSFTVDEMHGTLTRKNGGTMDILVLAQGGGVVGGEIAAVDGVYIFTAAMAASGQDYVIRNALGVDDTLDMSQIDFDQSVSGVSRVGNDLAFTFLNGTRLVIENHFTTGQVEWVDDGWLSRLAQGYGVETGGQVIDHVFFGPISGTSGDVLGGAGEDYMVWQGGGGSFDGGGGTYNGVSFLNSASTGVQVDLNQTFSYGGSNWARATIGTVEVYLKNVNEVDGTRFADIFTGNGAIVDGPPVEFRGYGGSDTFHSGGGFVAVLYDWSLMGISLTAGGGTMTVTYPASAWGAAGSDTLNGIFAVIGSQHADSLDATGSDTFHFLAGEGGDDVIRASAYGTHMTGGTGRDVLHGGAGQDQFQWRREDTDQSGTTRETTDAIYGFNGAGGDVISFNGFVGLELGVNVLVSAAGVGDADTLITVDLGNGEFFTIYVDAVQHHSWDASWFQGLGYLGGQTIIAGTGGDDTLIGTGGADTIIGGLGGDMLTGGAEADTFVFHSRADSSLHAHDTITDFTPGSDRLSFVGLANAGLYTGALTVMALPQSTAEQIRLNQDIPDNSVVFWTQQTNGTGTIDGYVAIKAAGLPLDGFFLKLEGFTGPLTAGDIVQMDAVAPANATILWDGGAGTTAWSDHQNWSSDSLPGPADDVSLASAVVNLGGDIAIRSLTASAGDLTMASGSLSLATDSFLDDLSIFSLSGGVLTGGGQLTTGALEWMGGLIDLGNGVVVTGGAYLGAGARTLDTALTLVGQSTLHGGTTSGYGQIINAGWMDVTGATLLEVGLVNAGVMTIDGVVVTSADSIVNTGILTLTGPVSTMHDAGISLSGGGSLDIVDGGVLQVMDGGEMGWRTITGNVLLSGGSILARGDITFDIEGAEMALKQGSITVDPSRTLRIDAGMGGTTVIAGMVQMMGAGEIVLAGTHTLRLDADFNYGSLVNGPSLSFNGDVTVTSDNGARFMNHGHFDLTGMGTVFQVEFRNHGHLTLDTMETATQVSFAGGLVNSGMVDLFSSWVGNVSIDAGTVTNQMSGSILVGGQDGHVSITGSVVNQGDITIFGRLALGSLTNEAGGDVNVGAGGQLSVSGLLDNQGRLWGEGTVIGAVANSGTISGGTIGGTGTLIIDGNLALDAASVLHTDIGRYSTDTVQVVGGATLGGTLHLDFDGYVPESGIVRQVMQATTIGGTFASLTHSLAATDWTVTYNVTNGIDVQNLVVMATLTNGEIWTDPVQVAWGNVHNKSVLIEEAAGAVTLTQAVALNDVRAFAMDVGGQTLTVNNSMWVGTSLTIDHGTLAGAGKIQVAGALNMVGGSLLGTGGIFVDGSASLAASIDLDKDLVLRNTTIIADGTAIQSFTPGMGSVTNRGTMTMGSANFSVVLANALGAAMVIDAANATATVMFSQLSNAGTLRLDNTALTQNNQVVNLEVWGTLVNTGTIVSAYGEVSTAAHTINGIVDNQGTLQVEQNLTVLGTLTNAAGMHGDGWIDIVGGGTTLAVEGNFHNNGIITTTGPDRAIIHVTMGTFTSNGEISPGGGGSIGDLSVSSLSLGNGALIALDLGAAGARDLLEVAGHLHLDGTLEINHLTTLAGSYIPLTWTTVSGSFDYIWGLYDWGSTYVLDPVFGATGLTLTVQNVTHTADGSGIAVTGTAAVADYMVGSSGDDVFHTGGGGDVVFAGDGSDWVGIVAPDFHFLDGGHGIDTLAFEGADGAELNLATIRPDLIQGFEIIDLSAEGSQHLIISGEVAASFADRVNGVTGLEKSLVILGQGDQLTLDGTGWTVGNPNATLAADPGGSYTIYSHAGTGAQIYVENTVAIAGTPA